MVDLWSALGGDVDCTTEIINDTTPWMVDGYFLQICRSCFLVWSMCAQLPIARLHRASLHFSPSALGCFISSDRFVYFVGISTVAWSGRARRARRVRARRAGRRGTSGVCHRRRRSLACVAEEDDEDCVTCCEGCSDGHGDDVVV